MQPKTSAKNKRPAAKQKREITFPLEKENFVIIGAGILVLIIGYFLMAQNSVDGFLPTVVAPIVLLAGYCVIIPYGILKKTKKAGDTAVVTEVQSTNVQSSTVSPVSSNIKTS
jgi:hypothetical protein